MESPPTPPEPPSEAAPPSRVNIDASGDVVIGGSVAGRDIIIQNYYQQVVSPGPADDDGEPPAPGDPPFKGLQYFDEADADRFFGREQLTARVVARLSQAQFLAIVGASGSGKSSLVRAGVIPALRRGQRLADGSLPPTDSGQWDIRTLTPTAHPLEALAAALTRESESVTALTTLQRELTGEPRALALAAQQLLARNGRRRLLLFVDQFEEVFTLSRQPAEREAFIDALFSAVAPEAQAPVTVLIALRADFYAQCAAHAGLRDLVSRQQEYIGAMSRAELMSAILQPAALGDWKIQEGLVELMLDEVGDEPGALPLLSHALLETWARRRGRKLTLSGYTEAGGIQGAIATTAEAVFQQRLAPAQRPIARMIFLRLTELGAPGEGGPASPDTRRRVPFSELITRATDEPTLAAVLNILADARLITTDTLLPGNTKVVEVAHEAIIREWPTLRRWLDENREGLIRQRQLTEDAAEWEQLGRDPGALYRGARLKQAAEYAERFPEPLSVLEQEFLDLSRANAAREAGEARRLVGATRSQRILAAVAAVAVLGLVGLIAFLWFVQNNAAQARMTGAFNIAVAQFSEAGPDGKLSPTPTVAGERLSLWAYGPLEADLTSSNVSASVWHDSGAPTDLGVVTDTATAQALASRVGADVVIYGLITPTGNGFGELELRFYIAPALKRNLGSLVGEYAVGAPIPVSLPSPGLESRDEIGRQVAGLTQVMLGMVYERLSQSEQALAAFSRAQDAAPDSAVTRFLIGQEHLFLAQKQTDGAEVAQSLDRAQAAFAQSLALDPAYPRASIGLGSALFYRAQLALVQNPPADCAGDHADVYRPVLTTVDDAIANFQRALGQEAVDASLTRAAQTALAQAYRLKAEVYCGLGDAAQAEAWIDQAVDLMTRALALMPETDDRDYRLMAQAYQGLGTIYEWKAYLKDDDPALYREAIAAYDKCIEQGQLYPVDQFLKDELIAHLCLPDRDRLQAQYGSGSS